MVQVNFNATQVAPNVAPEPIPSGKYLVQIVGSEEKATGTNPPGKQLVFEMQVLEGEFKGRKVFDRLNIVNHGEKKQQTEEIAYSTLSSICHVTQRLQITSTEQLHGVPFTAIVVKKPRGDDPTRDTNEVRGYLDAQGNKPGFAGATQGGAGATPGWAGQPSPGAAAAPPPPPPPGAAAPPPPPPAFPPAGWAAHPSAPGYFYMGNEVLSEADLRAKFAPPSALPAPPAPPAPPPVPQNDAGAGAAAATDAPPWLK